ncbi:hypothetical protein WJX73_006500 [Symbiochloris irregularis]|uniref:Histone chaperone n=1 Tax=Symbiochloris irregularis TaxID=706552 RepID=A0AAW1NQW8_9CHLO
MTAVNVTSVNVLNNPTFFSAPLQFEIAYECHCELQHDLEWKLTYVGSAESEKYDQVLDSVLVGPVRAGQFRFVFQTDGPDPAKLPPDNIVGVTVLLLTCSYKDTEFIRVGYYISNDYTEDGLRESPPEPPRLDLLTRSILAENPRVTRFPCDFDKPAAIPSAGGQENADPEVHPSSLDHMEQCGGMEGAQHREGEDDTIDGDEEEEEEEDDEEPEGEEAEEDDTMMEQ